MSLAQTFRDLIFEDCDRARRTLTVGKILEDKIFEVSQWSAKTAKILVLENF